MASLDGARVFLTGGTGFLGKALLKALLLDAGVAAITVLSRDPDAFLRRHPAFGGVARLDFVRGDVLTFDFPGAPYSHVIHAATDTSRPASDALAWYDEIVLGTRRMLDFALACGARRFLLTSSGAVYGPQAPDQERIDEAVLLAPSTMAPNSVYGQGKRAAEHLCALYLQQHGLACTVARCFAFVGETMPLDGQYALGNFIRDALDAQASQITVAGDGTPLRSYLHADEAAQWLLAILQRGAPCRPYNVGSEQAISIGELAHRVRDLLAPHKPVHIAQQRQDGAARTRYVPSTARAREELGLEQVMGLDAAIRATAAALDAKPA